MTISLQQEALISRFMQLSPANNNLNSITSANGATHNGRSLSKTDYPNNKSKEEGMVCLLVAVENKLMLMLVLSDEIRPESVDFVRTLKKMNLQGSMLTGELLI